VRPPSSDPPWGDWRYGFSDRLVAVDAFRMAREASTRSLEVRGAPWSEVKRVDNEIRKLIGYSRNPLRHHYLAWGFHTSSREVLARIRLLRAAARYRICGEILTLDDPFGKKLHSEERGVKRVFWSAGQDGNDDHGKGAWKRKDLGPEDIVLEIDR